MKLSAGILVYRRRSDSIEVLLVHPGGPFFAKKDLGAWSIPKGEQTSNEEDPFAAAQREFQEEIGCPVPECGEAISLGETKQTGGKVVTAWAVEGDCDVTEIKSNTFSLEWPPRSGKFQDFPEIDRAEWFPIEHAYERLLKAQCVFLERLVNTQG